MPPSARIAVDAIIGLDLVALLVAWLALLVVGLAVGLCFGRERSDRTGRGTGAEHAKELTTPHPRLALRFHSRDLPPVRARSLGQHESFCFDLDEQTSDGADVAVEIRRLGGREIGKEASDPWGEMLLEHPPLPVGCRRKLAADQTGHHLAQDGRVVFRLALRLDTFNAEIAQILAQAGQRTLVEKPGQVIRTEGQQLTAPDPDEEIEKLACD